MFITRLFTESLWKPFFIKEALGMPSLSQIDLGREIKWLMEHITALLLLDHATEANRGGNYRI